MTKGLLLEPLRPEVEKPGLHSFQGDWLRQRRWGRGQRSRPQEKWPTCLPSTPSHSGLCPAQDSSPRCPFRHWAGHRLHRKGSSVGRGAPPRRPPGLSRQAHRGCPSPSPTASRQPPPSEQQQLGFHGSSLWFFLCPSLSHPWGHCHAFPSSTPHLGSSGLPPLSPPGTRAVSHPRDALGLQGLGSSWAARV